MKETAAKLLDKIGREANFGTIKLGDYELAVPRSVPFFWLGKGKRFLGAIDASSFMFDLLYEHMHELRIEKLSKYTLDDLQSCSHDTPLHMLYNHEQEVYPLLNDDGSLVVFLNRTRILHYLYNDVNTKLIELEALFNSVHNGIVSIDKEGMVKFFNSSAERFRGVSKENVIGKHIGETFVPTGLLDIALSGKREIGFKFQIGNKKYITNRTPIIQEGRIEGAVGVFQEISEIERISEELSVVKDLNKKLSAVLESCYDGIIVSDMKGTVLNVNKACKRIFDIEEEEDIDKSVQEIITKVFFSKLTIKEMCKTGEPMNYQLSTETDNDLLVTASPVSDGQGTVNRVVVNVRDMTELNRLRQQLMYTKKLSDQYHSELTKLKTEFTLESGIIACSREMKELIDISMRIAKFDSSVLLLGESGVGKEVIARLIHNYSHRSKFPFIKINCGAIPESLLEAELFGYEPGSFTGATKEGKIGIFESANKGTLLLDEVGDIPFNLQVKLLRVLQEREVRRVGSSTNRSIDVRIISSTNHDLIKLIETGTFREDLYFRLNVVPIRIPPLRERKADIVPLLFHLNNKLEKKYKIKKEFKSEVIDLLTSYAWPGNIRELENVVEMIFVTCPEKVIESKHLPVYLFQNNSIKDCSKAVTVNRLVSLKEALDELEKQLISKAMTDLGSTYKAAEALAVNQSTIWRKWNRIRETLDAE